ncbi:MAG: O-antigen ligase family protein [Verrucomicrobiota bacterium]
MPPRLQKHLDWLTVWVCGTCIALLAADVVIGSYNAGLPMIKPSLFTPMVFMLCMGVCVLSRPRFCLPALLLSALPVMRLLDVAVLGRFVYSGTHDMTMNCLRILLVVMAILAVLSCPQGLKAMRWAAILTILLTSGSSIAEFLGVVKFSSIPGRFSGFNGHPNSPPIVLCQCLGLCFALVSSFRWNVALIAAAAPGVALTYGRSGMVIYAFLAGTYILLNARRHLGFLMVCGYAIVPLVLGGFAIMQQRTGDGVRKDKNTADRLEAIYNLDFDKLKSPERAKDLSDAWEAVMREPVFGHGVGAASSRWAPHNEYVAMWLELGLLGLLVYLLTIYVPIFRSLMCGGKAGYAVIAVLLYSPIAQGRVMDPHFYFTLLTAAHILWPQRFRLVARNQPDIAATTTMPTNQPIHSMPRRG